MRQKVIDRALLCLAETINDGNSFAEQETFPIEQFIDEAGRKVIMVAPLRALGVGKDGKSTSKSISEDGVVTMTLPQDFVRLIVFKMGNWMRPVFIPIYDTDPQYAMQFHPATRGGVVKPVVAITNGGTKLEAYSTTSGDSITNFNYIAYTAIDSNYPQKFVEATGWMAASLYLASMGELDMSKVAEAKSVELLQLL
jgi:hypothetical protein